MRLGSLSKLRCCIRRNPAHADIFVSCSGDNTAKVWDARQPRATLTIPAHQHEVGAVSHELARSLILLLWPPALQGGWASAERKAVLRQPAKHGKLEAVVPHAHALLESSCHWTH